MSGNPTVGIRMTTKGRVAVDELILQEKKRTGYDIRAVDVIAYALRKTYGIDIKETP